MFDAALVHPGTAPPEQLPRPPLLRLAAALVAVCFAGLLITSGARALPVGLAALTGSQAQPATGTGVNTTPEAAAGTMADTSAVAAEESGIDVGGATEIVSHHITPDPTQPDVLTAHDAAYTARFTTAGFTLAPAEGDGEGFALSLTDITRGSESIALETAAWASEANIASRPVAGDVTEQVTARDGEVQWDLILATEPAGSGDLVVQADVTGADTVDLGELIVVDASGSELLRVMPNVDGGRLEMTVPTAVLAGADYPLTLDPTVTPETFASGTPAPNDQERPALAFDGTNHLVIWSDDRSGDQDIYGTRVTTSGGVLDPSGIAISTAPGDQAFPTVAFDGTSYLVAWSDDRSGDQDIYGTRVTTSGGVLDPSGIAISTAPGDQEFPAVASDGTAHLVVWEDNRPAGFNLYGARVTSSGQVLDPSGIAISTAGGSHRFPAVAFDGTNYLVVWEDNRSGSFSADVYGARLTPTGGVLDPSGIAISNSSSDEFSPRLAFNGTNYLAVWQDNRSGSFDVYGARVTPSGEVLDTSDIAIATDSVSQFVTGVTSDGTNYLVVWTNFPFSSSDVYGSRVSTSGGVLDPSGIAVSTAAGNQFGPAVAFDGTNFLVVWTDERSGSSDVYGARVAPSGGVVDGPGILVSTTANVQSAPAVVFDGANYLVVWTDRRSGGEDIYGTLVSTSGQVRVPAGIAISTATGDQSDPAVSFDGNNFVVVWSDERSGSGSDIYGARLNRFGQVVDTSGFLISPAPGDQSTPAVTYGATTYLVTWTDTRSGSSSDIYAARVSPSATVFDPFGLTISTAPGDQSSPAIAFDGNTYLIVWQDLRAGGLNFDIYATRVQLSGSRLDPSGIPISTNPSLQLGPSVAYDGTNYLVVWFDFRSNQGDIYGTRVTKAAGVLDPSGIPISTASGNQTAPDVAYNGSVYLVVWRDERNGSDGDIYGARVAKNGNVNDPSGFAIATGPGRQSIPAVTHGPGDKWRVAYEGNYPGGTGIYTRTVSPK